MDTEGYNLSCTAFSPYFVKRSHHFFRNFLGLRLSRLKFKRSLSKCDTRCSSSIRGTAYILCASCRHITCNINFITLLEKENIKKYWATHSSFQIMERCYNHNKYKPTWWTILKLFSPCPRTSDRPGFWYHWEEGTGQREASKHLCNWSDHSFENSVMLYGCSS